MKLLRTAVAASVLAVTLPVLAEAQTSSCTSNAPSSGFVCNFYQGPNGTPSNVVTLPGLVGPGYIVWSTNSDFSQTQYWTNILRFGDGTTSPASTGQLFSDPFTSAFSYAVVNAAPHAYLAYTASQPMQFVASGPNTYNVYSDGLGTATTTPEPASFALLGTGIAGLLPVMRRRSRS